jgi:hypothetical protein
MDRYDWGYFLVCMIVAVAMLLSGCSGAPSDVYEAPLPPDPIAGATGQTVEPDPPTAGTGGTGGEPVAVAGMGGMAQAGGGAGGMPGSAGDATGGTGDASAGMGWGGVPTIPPPMCWKDSCYEPGFVSHHSHPPWLSDGCFWHVCYPVGTDIDTVAQACWEPGPNCEES